MGVRYQVQVGWIFGKVQRLVSGKRIQTETFALEAKLNMFEYYCRQLQSGLTSTSLGREECITKRGLKGRGLNEITSCC